MSAMFRVISRRDPRCSISPTRSCATTTILNPGVSSHAEEGGRLNQLTWAKRRVFLGRNARSRGRVYALASETLVGAAADENVVVFFRNNNINW
jgi:hypothetical protein